MAPQLPETIDGAQLRPASAGPANEGRLYLLVLAGDSCSLRPLPRDGTVLIGRAPEADLCIEDRSVSRHHARVLVTAGLARVVDLGSHNGVQVNSAPVQG